MVYKPSISYDYMIYLQDEYDVYDVSNLVTYQEAINCPQFALWPRVIVKDKELILMKPSHMCHPRTLLE